MAAVDSSKGLDEAIKNFYVEKGMERKQHLQNIVNNLSSKYREQEDVSISKLFYHLTCTFKGTYALITSDNILR